VARLDPAGENQGMLRLASALAVTVGLGLLSRLRPMGWPVYDKSLGDALYAAAAYLALALALPRWRPALVAALALAFRLAVECFQASGVPARYAHLVPVRWLLGIRQAAGHSRRGCRG
jgi:hypothetical protein